MASTGCANTHLLPGMNSVTIHGDAGCGGEVHAPIYLTTLGCSGRSLCKHKLGKDLYPGLNLKIGANEFMRKKNVSGILP
jgi:hypothetical protein